MRYALGVRMVRLALFSGPRASPQEGGYSRQRGGAPPAAAMPFPRVVSSVSQLGRGSLHELELGKLELYDPPSALPDTMQVRATHPPPSKQ